MDFFEVVLRAGKLMLMYGAETYRVEETMKRLAIKENPNAAIHTFVTPTGVFLTIANKGETRTQILRIKERGINLDKVAQLNHLSRDFEAGKIDNVQLEKLLTEIEKQKPLYTWRLQHLMAGVSAGSFAFLFGTHLSDFFPAFIAGILVNISFVLALHQLKVKFVAELCSSLVAGLVSISIYYGLGIGVDLNMIIIGALMPLVPGVAITNSIHDLMAGDLVAGVAKGAEALLTSLAVATGITVNLTIGLRLFQ